ncbi:aromatic ring-hydroxylating oxygenase subunit alpha [Streptomyces nigrescens]|uniref:(2Fe-2S) ferredoxin n=1 Tax=Streptomyces nigrescens TaxID=1920 RepID=A0A640T8T7_STRNI|nr:aromatic ring-hydroxylating dioxygenase subunit alpha [Streptomyces libani]WAT95007.1 aromatic ring-hydroxylating dioxygenase subunit alpha [Streptomyces libani subsp. libani]GFE20167.1 (2Fe-2S) ferredoxin [Streptomyces libani subsp. libani]GGV86031.1 (2Fe-2S) ferredoxin [Streptomyces libani subsp. libani]
MHPEATTTPTAPTAPTAPDAPGQALSARYYTDPAAAAAETQRIFAKSWQLVCHESDLPGPGARLAATVADREVLVVRTENGTLAGHLNVCRHRGTRLVSAPEASGKALRCPYHGWTYKLDGRLVGAPEARQIPCLDKPALGLFPVRVESFLGFVFANLDPDAVPLAEQCAGLAETVGHYAGTDLVPVGRSRIHDLAGAEVQHANWKVAVDNYLEGYHVPVAHPGLMRLLDYQGYTSEIDEAYVLFASPLRDKPSSNWAERLYQRLASPMPGLTEADRRVWRYAVIYPNTLIDFYPDHVLAWTAIPTAVDRVAVPGAFYTRRGTSARTRLARRLNIHIGWITNDEDAELVARVQKGLGTPGFEPGPLSRREAAVGWFADRVRTDLGGAMR